MAVFTYAASYIVTAIVGIGGAAILGSAGVAFVTSVVAYGLAYTTARVLGLNGGAGGTTQDPGVRIQFPPATNNKIPVVYGTSNTKGVVTDARLGNENKTMTYVLALSEQTQTGVFSVGDIYWNDQLLIFDTDNSERHIVRSSVDQNGKGASNTNYDGLIRVRVYSGGVEPEYQIFPTQASGNTVNARTLLGETDTNYLLRGTVFAVLQVDYNSEKGTTGLGQVTFQLSNTLTNPGLVWYDYMTSSRYGANIPAAQIDTNSSTNGSNPLSLLSWSNTIPPDQFGSDGTSPSTQPRYQINGVISTADTVRTNIDKINMASSSWTTYDYSQGRWKILLNRAATTEQLNSAFKFTDDNMIGDVSVSATNLEDIYNQLEVEFFSRQIRDQQDYYKAEIAQELRNALEPDNTLNMRIDLANNALHAARIGLIELKSSRSDLVLSFTADYSGLQCQAGDVVKITNSVYGFAEDLFRISRVREVELEDGVIVVEITALQYRADVYTDETLEDSPAVPGNDIPSFGSSASLPPPSAPTFTNISVDTNTFTINTVISSTSSPVDEVQWFYSTNGADGTYIYLTNEYAVGGSFAAGSTVSEVIGTLGDGTYHFRAKTGSGARYSNLSAASGALALTLPAPDAPTFSSIDTATNTFVISTEINGPADEVQWYYSTTEAGTYSFLANKFSSVGQFPTGTVVVSDTVTTLADGSYYIKARSRLGSRYSQLGPVSAELEL